MADANYEPFEQLAGMTLRVYIKASGATEPTLAQDPVVDLSYVELGPTDGGQTITHGGALTKFYDDQHQGPVKAVRPQEDITFESTIVGLTLEKYAAVLHIASDVTSAVGPPATKTMPLKRGRMPTLYTVVFRSEIASPYGSFPIQYFLPMAVFDGEPAPTFTKDGRAGLDLTILPIEDDSQAAGDELGWLTAQTA